jgi:cytidylate kinase
MEQRDRSVTVVAIDGPAGSGKSTVARRVAQELEAALLDTGAVYRTLALVARERQVSWRDGPALADLAGTLDVSFRLDGDLNRVMVGDREVTREIRTPEISRGASAVSAIPEVRRALLELQRRASRDGPIVAEGRDMGTVVFPSAEVKIYLDADPRERARRRQAELAAAGRNVTLDEVLAEQNERDAADSGRAVAPLRPAPDARVVDTTDRSVEEIVCAIVDIVAGAGAEA